jgi:type III pantothenate kinase
MILLVDVGNSRIKWMLWHQGQILERGNLIHKYIARASLGENCWVALKRPSQVIIANVAGAEMANALATWISRHWHLKAWFAVSQAEGFGIKNAYANPQRMGVDRWVALIGARALTQQNCCIVDCGTATTVDALSVTGEHLGGVIFPGSWLMREVLYRDTRQIPTEPGQVTLFGKDTQDCVWGGTGHAVAGAIDRITRRMGEAMQGDVCHLLTGGDAEQLLPSLEGSYRLEPDLVFQGLLVIAGQIRVSQ